MHVARRRLQPATLHEERTAKEGKLQAPLEEIQCDAKSSAGCSKGRQKSAGSDDMIDGGETKDGVCAK